MSNAPKGIGVYARTLSSSGDPKKMAKQLKDSGFSYVAFMACWQDKSGPNHGFVQRAGASIETTKKYAAACQAVGLDVWLWGFPWLGHEQGYSDMLVDHVRKIPGVKGLLHDVEVSYRDKNAKQAPAGSRGQGEAVTDAPEGDATKVQAAATLLMTLDRQVVTDLRLQPSGMSSYGMAGWHPLPWDTLADGGRLWGSPQLYTVTPQQVDQGLESWAKHKYGGLVPSIPAYGPNSGGKLDAHLSSFVDGGDEPTIDGFIVWSLPQISGVEWKTLAKWAEMLQKKAC